MRAEASCCCYGVSVGSSIVEEIRTLLYLLNILVGRLGETDVCYWLEVFGIDGVETIHLDQAGTVLIWSLSVTLALTV